MSNRNLLDPALEEVLESIEPSDEIEVAVRLKNPNDVPEELRVISRFGDVITCRIQAGLVRKVRSSPSIVSVKYNRPLALGFDPRADIESAYEELTLPNSYSDVYRIPRESGGEGVLVAFLDWGIAYAEKAFLDEHNETRFHAIWYQGADYSSEKPNKYGYGRIFFKDEINASLKTDDPYSFLGYHPAKADPLGIGSHGTHVCDIAAGSRRKIQNGYIQGIANKSGLIFVDLKADDTKGLSSLSSSIKVLEALDLVSDIAGNRPLVVNISAGSHGGPHDDSPLVVRAIDNLVSMNPGRIVCMSTGNYKMNQTHTEGIVKSGREKQFNWVIHETNMSDKELEIWYPGSDIFSLGIVLPGSKEILFTQLGEKKSITLNGVEVGKSYHRKDPLNNDHHIDIFIYKGAPVGKWEIILYGNDVTDGRYYAWIERDIDPRYQSKFEKKDSVINSTIGSICTGRQSIVVGAFDSRTSERKLAEFSSRGPTRNGIDKPDICALGVEIIAAKSTPLNSKPPTSLLVSKSGVSMATPYVSGAVALLVSTSKRMLTISEVRRILLGSADKCSDDNSCCGYGYLNIDAALGRVLDLTGFEYLIKENVFSGQEDDQNINYSSKVENFHPLQIKGSAISDPKFIGKMLNNSEHADGHNEMNEILVNETEAQTEQIYTNFVTAPRDGTNIIKIVADYIALSQGNIPHSDLLNHVLSEIGAFNIPDTRDLHFRGYSQLFFNSNLTPEMIYNIFTLPQYRYSKMRYHDIFEVVARPGTKISGKLNSGDLLIRKMDTNYYHLAFIVSPQVMTFGDLVRNNFTAERSNQKEGYVHVVEGKPRHGVIDRFARVICDSYGVVPDSQMVIGIKFGRIRDPGINLYDSLSTYDYADPARVDARSRQPIKQILDDDLLESMNMFIESEKKPIVNPKYANKPDSFFLRIYRRKLESTDIDLVESQVLANMSSQFSKIVEHVSSNLGKYPQRTHAKKFFAAGLVDQKFQSSRKKFRATKDKTTAQVVREFLMEGKIVVRSKEEDIDTIELKIEQELLGAQVHYNAAVTSFLNTMSTELADPPNLNAIMAINLSNTIKEFDVFQAKSVSEFASSKLTQIVSKEIIGQTLEKIPVFGTIIKNFTDLAFNMIEAKEKAKKEYAAKLEEYRKKQQRVYLSDFINNLLKSDAEKYEKFVKEFLKNLRRAYDAALNRIQIKIEQDKLRYDFVEIYYDLLDRAESLNKNTKLYELEFYLSWIKAVGLSPAEKGLQIAISDPIKKFGFVDFSPRAFITGLYSRNVAKGLKDVLRSQNMNVLDLKIQKKVYFLAVRHSDKDFQEVLRLSASGPLTLWITEQNHIFFPKINQLNRVQADEFYKLLSPEMLGVLKATAEIDKGTDTGFSFDNAFKKIEMDWNPAIWSGITLVEDARLVFGKPKGLPEEFEATEIGEDVPDSKKLISMINAELSDKVKLDPNVLTDPMKLKKLEIDLTDFAYLKVTPSKKDQPVNANDRKKTDWSLMQKRFVKPAIDNYKKQREEENRQKIEHQKLEAANTPTLDLGVAVARSLKVMKDKNLISIYNKNSKRTEQLDPHAIDVLTCILTRAQDPDLRGYISWNDYSPYTTEISGSGLTPSGVDRLKAAGILDQAGKWNKYGFVQDFLRKPYYFDPSKKDMDYLESLSKLYFDILWVINNIVETKGKGDAAPHMIVSLGDFILKEKQNKHSVYQCFFG